MPAQNGAHQPGPAEFDRIVSRLRAEDPQFADPKRFPSPAGQRGPSKAGDGLFVTGCFAVIVTMSLVIGGWIGLLAFVTSTLVLTPAFLREEAGRSR